MVVSRPPFKLNKMNLRKKKWLFRSDVTFQLSLVQDIANKAHWRHFWTVCDQQLRKMVRNYFRIWGATLRVVKPTLRLISRMAPAWHSRIIGIIFVDLVWNLVTVGMQSLYIARLDSWLKPRELVLLGTGAGSQTFCPANRLLLCYVIITWQWSNAYGNNMPSNILNL